MQYYVVKNCFIYGQKNKMIISYRFINITTCEVMHNLQFRYFFLLSERSLKKVWDTSSFPLPRFLTFMNDVNYN